MKDFLKKEAERVWNELKKRSSENAESLIKDVLKKHDARLLKKVENLNKNT